MRLQFLRHHSLINGTEIDACHIIHHRLDVGAEENTGQNTHIVHIKFEQIFTTILYQGETWLADGLHFQRNARRNQIVELLDIITHSLSLLVLNILHHYSLLLVFQVRRNHAVDALNLQAIVHFLITGRIHTIEVMNFILYGTNDCDILGSQEFVDGIRQASYQEILLEQIEQFVMDSFRHRLP